MLDTITSGKIFSTQNTSEQWKIYSQYSL
jgi:hypothetical protein